MSRVSLFLGNVLCAFFEPIIRNLISCIFLELATCYSFDFLSSILTYVLLHLPEKSLRSACKKQGGKGSLGSHVKGRGAGRAERGLCLGGPGDRFVLGGWGPAQVE